MQANKEIHDLLVLYLDTKKLKREHILLQSYEKVAKLRDMEKKYSSKICEIIDNHNIDVSISEVEETKFFPVLPSNFNKIDIIVNKYCIKNYGISVFDHNALLMIKRYVKLRNLGLDG